MGPSKTLVYVSSSGKSLPDGHLRLAGHLGGFLSFIRADTVSSVWIYLVLMYCGLFFHPDCY